MSRHWVVWANVWTKDGLRTSSVEVTASSRNEALKKGNKKLNVPPAKREPLRIYERK